MRWTVDSSKSHDVSTMRCTFLSSIIVANEMHHAIRSQSINRLPYKGTQSAFATAQNQASIKNCRNQNATVLKN